MKTLKKTLALVLALVMMMSLLGTIPAGAFKDDDEITYKDAVDLLSTLGIIKGMGDDTFDPDGTLTRAQGATIITSLMLTPEVAGQLVAQDTGFTDVPAYHWASKYVAWAVEKGIIVGYGDGTFGPEDPLTGIQFLKMIEVMFGYGAKGEFSAASWVTNTSQLALQLGLVKEVTDALTNTKSLLREQAAKIASNSIMGGVKFVRFVEFLNDYVTGDVFGAGTGENSLNDKDHYDIQQVPGTIGFDNVKNTLTFKSNTPGATDKFVAVEIPAPNAIPADFGRNVKVTVANANNAKTAKATGAVAYTDAVLYQSGKAVDFAKVTDKADSTFKAAAAASKTDIEVIANGVKTTNTTSDANGKISLAATTNGTLTILINKAGETTGVVDQIIFVSKTFGILTDDAKTTTSGNTTTVTVAGTVLPGGTNVNKVVGYEGLKKNDAVLLTTMTYSAGVNNYYLEKAPSVTGVLAGYSGTAAVPTGVTIDSTLYSKSGINGAASYQLADFTNTSGNYGKKFIVWTDGYNNAISMKAETAAATPDYYVLLSIAAGSGFDSLTQYARLLAMDGTTKDIKTDQDAAALNPMKDKFVTYAASSTKSDAFTVSLVAPTATTLVKTGAAADYTQGKANIIKIDGTLYYGNSASKFVFSNGSKYSVYEGYANAPVLGSGTTLGTAEALVGTNGIIKFAYLPYSGGSLVAPGTSQTNVYVLKKGTEAKVDFNVTPAVTYYNIDIVDTKGNTDTLKVKQGTEYDKIGNAGAYLFTATVDSTGYASLTAITGPKTGYAMPSGGTFVIGGTAYTYDDSTVVLVTTRAASGTATYVSGVGTIAAADANDLAYVGLKTGSTEALAYVVIEVIA